MALYVLGRGSFSKFYFRIKLKMSGLNPNTSKIKLLVITEIAVDI